MLCYIYVLINYFLTNCKINVITNAITIPTPILCLNI